MMTPSLVERACRSIGEVYEFLDELAGRPLTAEEYEWMKSEMQQNEQLLCAATAGMAKVVSELRNGVDAKRSRQMNREWKEAQELDAVKRHIMDRKQRLRRIRREY